MEVAGLCDYFNDILIWGPALLWNWTSLNQRFFSMLHCYISTAGTFIWCYFYSDLMHCECQRSPAIWHNFWRSSILWFANSWHVKNSSWLNISKRRRQVKVEGVRRWDMKIWRLMFISQINYCKQFNFQAFMRSAVFSVIYLEHNLQISNRHQPRLTYYFQPQFFLFHMINILM